MNTWLQCSYTSVANLFAVRVAVVHVEQVVAGLGLECGEVGHAVVGVVVAAVLFFTGATGCDFHANLFEPPTLN